MKADPEDYDAAPEFRAGTHVTQPKLAPDALREAEERLRALGYL